jgi:hypothetical protein
VARAHVDVHPQDLARHEALQETRGEDVIASVADTADVCDVALEHLVESSSIGNGPLAAACDLQQIAVRRGAVREHARIALQGATTQAPVSVACRR